MQTISQYDVLIVGGGIVGLTLAAALSELTTLSIAVIDTKELTTDWQSGQYLPRVSAMTQASKRLFQSLQVWPEVVAKRVSAFNRIEVWNSGQKQYALPFDSQEINLKQLGYIIENDVMQIALMQTLAKKPQVQFIKAALTQFTSDDDAVYLTTAEGICYRAKLAVGADGANSWLRKQASIALQYVDYEQSAIVATISTQLAHDNTARQCFLQGGPLGILPLNSAHLSSIVWSQPKGRACYRMKLALNDFKRELQIAMDDCLGEVTQVLYRHLFPLKRQQAANYIGKRLALIGDAAHVVHPMAGQGVNMGLLDAAALAEVIQDAIALGADFATHKVLRRYERWRFADNSIMQQGIDVIKTMFANEYGYLTKGVNLSMRALARLPFLKNRVMCHAVGDRANLPRLAT